VRTAPAPEARRYTSEQLLGSATQIVIEHAGQEYRLCRTRNGKLILVK
jgi:hemin uptake protein HemP